MRILLTTHQFLPEFSAGTEVLTFEVVRELQRRGHDVRVLSGSPHLAESAQTRGDDYAYEGIEVHRIRSLPVDSSIPAELVRREYDDPETARQLDLIRTAWQPDLVHFFHLQRLTGSLVHRCADLSIPMVYTPTDFWAICPLNQLRLPDGSACSGPSADSSNCILHLAMAGRHRNRAAFYRWIPDSLPGRMLRMIPRWLIRSRRLDAARELQYRPRAMRVLLNEIDRVMPATRFMAAQLEMHGASRKSLRSIAYGIDRTGYDNLGPVGTSERLRIGFIGALNANKGAHVLLAAAAMMHVDAAFSIEIYGDETSDPDYTKCLRDRAVNDGRIRFCGTFERKTLPVILNRMDVVVVPSTWIENMPLVVLGALTAGRPVIGSNVPGIAEVVTDGSNGYLFEIGDSTRLASILQLLINDRDGLRMLASNTRPAKSIAQYTTELEQLYDEVTAERQARRTFVLPSQHSGPPEKK